MSSTAERTAFAKVRARIRRHIAEAEEAEHEGGEINLVPYLDIVVNTVMFMLATSALSLALANVNVSAPRYEEPIPGSSASDDPSNKDALNLTVGITDTGFTIGGSAAILPKIPCRTQLRQGRCPAYLATKANAKGEQVVFWMDGYNYRKLEEKIKEIKLFKDAAGNYRFRNERQAIITADQHIPYNVVVRTMDTIRGGATAKCTGDDGCYFDQVILSAGVQ
ncbi:MAG: biopolymer transporter ExbD [Deltaproteobacteria bacterium]|nr:biopolymer transporter ExbD [Deltaproteobacteria bacterium]